MGTYWIGKEIFQQMVALANEEGLPGRGWGKEIKLYEVYSHGNDKKTQIKN